MFYFLVFNSSISKTPNPNKRMLTTLLYGTVAYICFHAILSSSKNEFLGTIQQYFWMFIVGDLGASIYMYNEYCDQKKFKGNVFTQFMIVFTKFMDGILSSKITGISYGLDEYDDSDDSDSDNDSNSDDDEDNDSDDEDGYSINKNNKETFKNKKKRNKSKKKHPKNGILKRRVSFNNEKAVKHFQKDDIISSSTQNTIPVTQELQNSQNEMSELNKQLLALQKQQEQETQPKMGTSISAIRNKQVGNVSQTQTSIPSLPTAEINEMINNTDELLQNKDNIKNEDLVNMKLNYDPNINLNDSGGNVPNLKLDNFVENPITELEKDNSAQVNELFKSYSNNLSGTSTDVKENFQQQMEQFNKQKEALLKKQMSQKDQHQNVYNPNLDANGSSDAQSVVSSASDLGSVMDFDMDDFANTL
jgi:hypothetical protein